MAPSNPLAERERDLRDHGADHLALRRLRTKAGRCAAGPALAGFCKPVSALLDAVLSGIGQVLSMAFAVPDMRGTWCLAA